MLLAVEEKNDYCIEFIVKHFYAFRRFYIKIFRTVVVFGAGAGAGVVVVVFVVAGVVVEVVVVFEGAEVGAGVGGTGVSVKA